MVKHRKLRPEEKQQKSFAGHIREFFNENFRAFYNPRQIARKVGAKNEMQKREVAEPVSYTHLTLPTSLQV